MTRAVYLLSLTNETGRTREVILEPLAATVALEPGEAIALYDVMGREDCPAEISLREEGLTVWLNFEGFIVHRGEVVKNHPYEHDDAEPLRVLKEGMTRIWRKRGDVDPPGA